MEPEADVAQHVPRTESVCVERQAGSHPTRSSLSIIQKKGGRLLSVLVAVNMLLIGCALVSSGGLPHVAIRENEVLFLLTVLMALAVICMLIVLYYTFKNPEDVLYKDSHAGPIWLRGGLVFFGVFILLQDVFKIGYSLPLHLCESPIKIIYPVMQAIFVIIQTYFLWMSCKKCIQFHTNLVRAPPLPRRMPDLAALHERDCIRRYRFTQRLIDDLTGRLEAQLLPRHRYPSALTPKLKVMAALHFLATGTFQHTIADVGGMSQTMFSRVLHDFLEAMLVHLDEYIKFPNPEQLTGVKREFYALGGMPHVIGSIDGTHVALVPPQAQEVVYRNRKHYHSINALVVCLANMVISHVCVRFPGSAHDAFIMRRSRVPEMMLQLRNERACIVGDAGYPNMPWLMTPVRNPSTAAEHRYNNAHGRTRRVIERTFGLLKSRFRCLHKTGGALPYAPVKVCKIIIVCCMLHNMAVEKAVPLILDPDDQDHPPVEDEGLGDGASDVEEEEAVEDIRSRLIRDFFA